MWSCSTTSVMGDSGAILTVISHSGSDRRWRGNGCGRAFQCVTSGMCLMLLLVPLAVLRPRTWGPRDGRRCVVVRYPCVGVPVISKTGSQCHRRRDAAATAYCIRKTRRRPMDIRRERGFCRCGHCGLDDNHRLQVRGRTAATVGGGSRIIPHALVAERQRGKALRYQPEVAVDAPTQLVVGFNY